MFKAITNLSQTKKNIMKYMLVILILTSVFKNFKKIKTSTYHIRQISETQCDLIDNCYECNSPNSNCEWKNGQCVDSTSNDIKWYTKLDLCYFNDSDSKTYSDQNCDTAIRQSDDKSSTFTFTFQPNEDGNFGEENLFCHWEVSYDYLKSFSNFIWVDLEMKKKASVTFFFKIMRIIDNKTIENILEFDDTVTRKIYFEREEKVSKKFAFVTYFFSNSQFNKQPFSISIEFSKKTSKVTLYLVSAIIAFIALILAYLQIITCKKYFCEKKKNNVDKLNIPVKVFKDIFIKQKKLFNSKCPICLEDFKNENTIYITVCQHGFHCNCFEQYIAKNVKNNSCPLCDFKFRKYSITNNNIVNTNSNEHNALASLNTNSNRNSDNRV